MASEGGDFGNCHLLDFDYTLVLARSISSVAVTSTLPKRWPRVRLPADARAFCFAIQFAHRVARIFGGEWSAKVMKMGGFRGDRDEDEDGDGRLGVRGKEKKARVL